MPLDAGLDAYGDATPPDAAQPDQSTPDLPPPDSAQPDLAQPDMASPDQLVPDQTPPDMAPPLVITTKTLPEGYIGKLLNAPLQASGGAPPYTWSPTGTYPTWLSLTKAGLVAGKPVQSGLFNVSLMVKDSVAQTAKLTLQLKVVHVILLSAFGPFTGYPVNPSWQAIQPLAGLRLGDYEVRTVKLPVEWVKGTKLFIDAIKEHHPRIVVSAGVAGGLNKMRLESTARNRQVGKDVVGDNRNGSPVVAGAPYTLTTGLPLAKLQAALKPTIGSQISSNAGTYLCNQIFYTLMHQVTGAAVLAGFIHTPSYGVKAADVTAAWKVVLNTLIAYKPGPPPPAPAPQISAPPIY